MEDSEEGDDNRTDAQSYGPCRWRIAMVTYQSNSDSSIVFRIVINLFVVWIATFLHNYTLFGSITLFLKNFELLC